MSTENMSFMDKLMAKVDVIAGPMTRFGQIPFIKAVVFCVVFGSATGIRIFRYFL